MPINERNINETRGETAPKKLQVAVLFGGCSEEHDISVKSAVEVAKSLDPTRYQPLYIGITRAGEWRLCARPALDWEDGPLTPVTLSPDRGVHGLLALEPGGGYRILPVDVVLPVLHGKGGEDGAVQGLLELAGLPYGGCGIAASALCMDKALAYLVAERAGVATPRHWVCAGGKLPAGAALQYPVFVKPARSGSSFGVSRVECPEALAFALEKARRYDEKVLVEEAVTGCETGCAILGEGEKLTVGEVDQILLSHGFFRVHQEKTPEQGSENSQVIVPAAISAEDRARVRRTAKTVYRALGCRGLARVDLFLQPDGRVVLNEVNTFPGCTAYSRYPRMMAAAGVTMAQVLDKVIALALKK
ncbi:MAG: D-alanine--D-alanine ligase [Gemmiger sp.]|nr:D-alanine--D-alanine ligase [Gemmiger sp.]